jgi:hypothetical protein
LLEGYERFFKIPTTYIKDLRGNIYKWDFCSSAIASAIVGPTNLRFAHKNVRQIAWNWPTVLDWSASHPLTPIYRKLFLSSGFVGQMEYISAFLVHSFYTRMSSSILLFCFVTWSSNSANLKVWFCLVLCGSVWFCVVLCGSVWFCLVLSGSVWFCLVLSGSVWFCLVLSDSAWFCLVLSDSVWISLVLSGYVWFGLVRLVLSGYVWFCLVLPNTNEWMNEWMNEWNEK